MQSRIFRSNHETPLNGVLEVPESPLEDLCVIILNSGLMHHVGTSRFSVSLARNLSAKGLMSLRFDFSGLGDSEPRRVKSAFAENAKIELCEVMDQLEADYGVKRFLLCGLCSGADVSFYTAQEDDRVVGIAQIDPYLYRTNKWYLKHYLPRVLDVPLWLGAAKRALGITKANAGGGELIPDSAVETADEARELPPRQLVEGGYVNLVAKQCRIFVLITGGQLYTCNYAAQFRELYSAVQWGDLLEDHFLPEAGHVLAEPKYQSEVSALIVGWAKGF